VLKLKLLIAVILCACLSGVVPSFGSGAQTREERVKDVQKRLLDYEPAQYKLKPLLQGRGYEFCNNTSARIISFHLGCVERKKHDLRIVETRPLQEKVLEPAKADRIECVSWDSDHGIFLLQGEECNKGKLAVVEVSFADGGKWTLR
jgi:hypothetical protein